MMGLVNFCLVFAYVHCSVTLYQSVPFGDPVIANQSRGRHVQFDLDENNHTVNEEYSWVQSLS